VNLNELFAFQDRTLAQHLSSSKVFSDTFNVISGACSLITDMVPNLAFQREKKGVLALFSVEILTAASVATRLALSGNTPESLGILRFAIERCAQLLFVVSEKRYKTAMYEIDSGFDQVSYEEAFSSMGDLGHRIKRLHGEISEAAAHASAARMNWYSSQQEDKIHFGPGYQHEDERVAVCLEWCLDSLHIVIHCVRLAHEQDELAFKWDEQCSSLSQSYVALKRQYDLKLGREQPPKGSDAATA
jgi:hypothetical protein